MKVIRIVLLIGNGVWLPDFIVEKFSKLYFFATYPTAHDYIFASVLLAAAIPTVTGSFTLPATSPTWGSFRRTRKMKYGPAHHGS
jgi:hypothetical protein